MTVRWQRVGCLLVVPYASVTSVVTVPSGETTGYVRVTTVVLSRYGSSNWPYWMRTTVLESANVDSSKYTPKIPYGSSFIATHTAKGSPLAPDVPTLSLHLGNDEMELVIILYTVARWGNDLRERIPWPLIQARCYVG